MNEEDRLEILRAMNKAIECFNKTLNWSITVPIKITAREWREGDWSLGEEVTIDGIKEWEENQKTENHKEDD